ncbi:hypothetical protein I545_1758 [Mycobacterium kansasii 662]|uniref:Uncharacterized protein n=2 Tax=Mycobacterium kansasii TaxID=1768 RepID=A0A1V3XL38_MYCKA|nr:hypothetical protein I547_3527 [Mycobacterium kansasii 824]EUA20045.1 hypothetical protein I545_1758 [Mycobacterium kansasii 662]KEP39783.1 hypothetical protein MKSMC1_50760 [Mycobacterium kansasii]OOK79099.1 hypothetical protein BZL30_2646 [Mycobacterium kansasii]OOK79909.1 hypothetical protein BZL29_2603 [Mycobacterium kansasii]
MLLPVTVTITLVGSVDVDRYDVGARAVILARIKAGIWCPSQ